MNQSISLDFKFQCYGNSKENNNPFKKTKDYCLLTIRRVYHQFFFKLLHEHHFCLNNRPFVYSITDNNFDFGCHSNDI